MHRAIVCLALLVPFGCSPAASNAGFETGQCIQDECYDGLQCLSSLCVAGDGETDPSGPGDGGGGLDGLSGDDDDDAQPGDDDDDDEAGNDDDDDDAVEDTGGDDDDDDAVGTTGDTGGDPTGDDDDDDATGDPPPSGNPYADPAAGCPAGTSNGNDRILGINACLPDCDPNAATAIEACPQPVTATAQGVCATSSIAPGAACDELYEACATPGEFCVESPTTGLHCAVGAWCVLTCFDGETCPDGMACSALGVCAW